MANIHGEAPGQPSVEQEKPDILSAFRDWADGGMVDGYDEGGISCTGEVIVGSDNPISEIIIKWSGSDQAAVNEAYSAYSSPPGMEAKTRIAPHNISNNNPTAEPMYQAEIRSFPTPELANKLRQQAGR